MRCGTPSSAGPSAAAPGSNTPRASPGAPAARPSLPAMSPPADTTFDVALDTSALALSRAGTARYVRGLLDALADEPGLRVRERGFRAGSRLAVPLRDVGWYLGALPLLARGADVLH